MKPLLTNLLAATVGRISLYAYPLSTSSIKLEDQYEDTLVDSMES
jgi:predicted thioredoxin/glutaredoxin